MLDAIKMNDSVNTSISNTKKSKTKNKKTKKQQNPTKNHNTGTALKPRNSESKIPYRYYYSMQAYCNK